MRTPRCAKPNPVTCVDVRVVRGNPKLGEGPQSYVERQNCTLCRCTRISRLSADCDSGHRRGGRGESNPRVVAPLSEITQVDEQVAYMWCRFRSDGGHSWQSAIWEHLPVAWTLTDLAGRTSAATRPLTWRYAHGRPRSSASSSATTVAGELSGIAPARAEGSGSYSQVTGSDLAGDRARREDKVAGRPLHTFEVVGSEELTPHMVRVVLGGSGFETFTPSGFTDSYVKLVFVPDDVDVAGLLCPLTLDSFGGLPAEKQPVVRTMTVRRVDPAARQIAIDVVVHGEHGAAGLWAVAAEPGQPVYLMGPSGAYAPDPAADWHLFAGDESALPAISVALEALPPKAIGKVFIEVAGPEDEIPLTVPESIQVNWIYRGGRADLVGEDRAGDHAPLIEAVTSAPWLPGQVHAFIHGEAQAVMHNLRPYIRKDRGVAAKWASISGYWRRGRTEETFRQWKNELAAAEEAAAAVD